jgi:transcriptional regulator with XRE-family HTH domain
MKGLPMSRTILGAKLKKLRDEKNLTQADLSKKIGFSDNYIAKIESGTMPSMKTYQRLADFFQVPVEYLVSEREVDGVVPPVQYREVLEAILRVDKMSQEDRRLVLDVIEVIEKKDRFQEQASKKKR